MSRPQAEEEKECSRQREVDVFKAMAGWWEGSRNRAQGVGGPGWQRRMRQEEAQLGEISKVTFPALEESTN